MHQFPRPHLYNAKCVVIWGTHEWLSFELLQDLSCCKAKITESDISYPLWYNCKIHLENSVSFEPLSEVKRNGLSTERRYIKKALWKVKWLRTKWMTIHELTKLYFVCQIHTFCKWNENVCKWEIDVKIQPIITQWHGNTSCITGPPWEQSQVACSVPSHYPNQYWHIVNWAFGNKFQRNCNKKTMIFIQQNAVEYVVCKISAILSRPLCDIRRYVVIILGMCSANERRRYSVTSSLIGWAHTKNDPCRNDVITRYAWYINKQFYSNHNSCPWSNSCSLSWSKIKTPSSSIE